MNMWQWRMVFVLFTVRSLKYEFTLELLFIIVALNYIYGLAIDIVPVIAIHMVFLSYCFLYK